MRFYHDFKPVRRTLKLILLLTIAFYINPGFSQGTINAPKRDCLGSFTNFSYTPPAGLTLSSANWKFGDAITSSNISPVHSYADTGMYTVIIEATFSNSSTRTDSTKIHIVGVPRAAMYYDKYSDSCFNNNRICYFDTSRPAKKGQAIKKRLIVWGDGSFGTTNNPPFGQALCHQYMIPDKYDLRIEVTDTFGCMSSQTAVIHVVENIDADFSFNTGFFDCNTAQLCVVNTSVGGNPATEHYKWLVDTSKLDTMKYFSSAKCIRYKANRTGKITLIAHANNNCIDTMTKTFTLLYEDIPPLNLSDTVECFEGDPAPIFVSYKNVPRDGEQWFWDNGACGDIDCPPGMFARSAPYGHFAKPPAPPGWHTVRVDIKRGQSICPIERKYFIRGPMATSKGFDSRQCLSNNEVFFIENCPGVRREDCIFRWNIEDPYGGKCIAHRAKDINKYMNCNGSLDYYIKHKFNENHKTQYKVWLWAKDTVSGCEDSGYVIADMKYCCNLIYLDSVDVCQNKAFYGDVKGPEPDKFTLDSAGQVWKVFPGLLGNLKGTYDVGMIFKTIVSPWVENYGDDSIRLHNDSFIYADTVYKKKYLHIRGRKEDSLYARIYGQCRPPLKVSLHFTDGMFSAGDSINVSWGGGDSGDYSQRFVTNTKIDSLTQTYNLTGLNTLITVKMQNRWGCDTTYFVPLIGGKFVSMNAPKRMCMKDSACFVPYIYDMKILDFWSGNSGNKKVWWWFDDIGLVNSFKVCRKFPTGGGHEFKMFVSDSVGCLDTLTDSIFVQDVHAGVKSNSKFIYCSELRQFFDSSSLAIQKGDSIKRYSWQFGTGVFSSLQKDPLQSITTSLEKIHASHAVESASGCFDTVNFDINIIGPKPYFRIRDTIGCGSLNAQFLNLSRDCKQYIWQYGDSAKTNFPTGSKQPVNFLYNKPGRYYISLVGIDTVYNPFTNTYKPCISTFPDKLFQKDTTRSVLVLPFYKTGIQSRDTICLGASITFRSLSDTAYDYDLWSMGDSSFFTLSPGIQHTYQYKKTGLYTVDLKPGYSLSINNHCRDSARKTVLVLGVNADFDIDPASVPPVFVFHNKSNPASAFLKWDFGHGSATSSDQDPSHDYGKDTGTFRVCLIASLPETCSDTVCKDVFNNHTEDFGIYNVFTPGLIDGKNDKYDIQIENEDLYELLVYDRWGKLVFEGREDSDNTQEGNWNGKVFNKGAECPAGTYYYIFRYSMKQKPGEVITINGIIMLIR